MNTAAGPLITCIDTLYQALSEYTLEYMYYNTFHPQRARAPTWRSPSAQGPGSRSSATSCRVCASLQAAGLQTCSRTTSVPSWMTPHGHSLRPEACVRELESCASCWRRDNYGGHLPLLSRWQRVCWRKWCVSATGPSMATPRPTSSPMDPRCCLLP